MSTARSAFPSDPPGARHIVLMGVSGCGKSSVGAEVSRRSGIAYLDADTLHGEDNLRKMRNAQPLTDADRWPWLDRCAAALRAAPEGMILGCSALRRVYRDRLRAGSGGHGLALVHLDGSMDLLRARMASRPGHFMPPALLQSQFDTLERPDPDENALVLDVALSVPQLALAILSHFRLPEGTSRKES